MIFFDLDLGAWVRNPGSDSPPQMEPVLTVGATYHLLVKFIRGTTVQDPSGGTLYGGLKLKSDYSGDILADDAAPTVNGDGSAAFSIDLTTVAAKAYFTANPTADTTDAVFVIAATIDDYEFKTPPFSITLQNDYLPEQ